MNRTPSVPSAVLYALVGIFLRGKSQGQFLASAVNWLISVGLVILSGSRGDAAEITFDFDGWMAGRVEYTDLESIAVRGFSSADFFHTAATLEFTELEKRTLAHLILNNNPKSLHNLVASLISESHQQTNTTPSCESSLCNTFPIFNSNWFSAFEPVFSVDGQLHFFQFKRNSLSTSQIDVLQTQFSRSSLLVWVRRVARGHPLVRSGNYNLNDAKSRAGFVIHLIFEDYLRKYEIESDFSMQLRAHRKEIHKWIEYVLDAPKAKEPLESPITRVEAENRVEQEMVSRYGLRWRESRWADEYRLDYKSKVNSYLEFHQRQNRMQMTQIHNQITERSRLALQKILAVLGDHLALLRSGALADNPDNPLELQTVLIGKDPSGHLSLADGEYLWYDFLIPFRKTFGLPLLRLISRTDPAMDRGGVAFFDFLSNIDFVYLQNSMELLRTTEELIWSLRGISERKDFSKIQLIQDDLVKLLAVMPSEAAAKESSIADEKYRVYRSRFFGSDDIIWRNLTSAKRDRTTFGVDYPEETHDTVPLEPLNSLRAGLLAVSLLRLDYLPKPVSSETPKRRLGEVLVRRALSQYGTRENILPGLNFAPGNSRKTNRSSIRSLGQENGSQTLGSSFLKEGEEDDPQSGDLVAKIEPASTQKLYFYQPKPNQAYLSLTMPFQTSTRSSFTFKAEMPAAATGDGLLQIPTAVGYDLVDFELYGLDGTPVGREHYSIEMGSTDKGIRIRFLNNRHSSQEFQYLAKWSEKPSSQLAPQLMFGTHGNGAKAIGMALVGANMSKPGMAFLSQSEPLQTREQVAQILSQNTVYTLNPKDLDTAAPALEGPLSRFSRFIKNGTLYGSCFESDQLLGELLTELGWQKGVLPSRSIVMIHPGVTDWRTGRSTHAATLYVNSSGTVRVVDATAVQMSPNWNRKSDTPLILEKVLRDMKHETSQGSQDISIENPHKARLRQLKILAQELSKDRQSLQKRLREPAISRNRDPNQIDPESPTVKLANLMLLAEHLQGQLPWEGLMAKLSRVQRLPFQGKDRSSSVELFLKAIQSLDSMYSQLGQHRDRRRPDRYVELNPNEIELQKMAMSRIRQLVTHSLFQDNEVDLFGLLPPDPCEATLKGLR